MLHFRAKTDYLQEKSCNFDQKFIFTKVAGFSCENSLFSIKKCWIFEKNTSFSTKIIPFWRMILRKSSFKIKRNFSNFQKFWIGLDFLPTGNLVFSDFRFSDIFLSKILFLDFFEGSFEFFRGFSSIHFRTFQLIFKLRLFLDRKHDPRLILDYPRNRYDGIDPKNDRYFQVIGQILTWILDNLFLALV